MQITYNIPDEIAADAVNALCWKNNYQAKILNASGEQVNNPESKAAFAKRMVLEYVRRTYIEYARETYLAAGASAEATANSEANTISEVN